MANEGYHEPDSGLADDARDMYRAIVKHNRHKEQAQVTMASHG